jgi:hypothetical protein
MEGVQGCVPDTSFGGRRHDRSILWTRVEVLIMLWTLPFSAFVENRIDSRIFAGTVADGYIPEFGEQLLLAKDLMFGEEEEAYIEKVVDGATIIR